MLAMFPGIRFSRPITYDDYCGLELNLDRVKLRHADVFVQAMRIAGSKDPVDPAWADAVSNDPESTEETLYEINSERAVARAMERIKSRGFPD